MRRLLFALGLCCALFFAAAQNARADTVINFDGLADGTNISNYYAGVTFSCFSSGNHCPGGLNTGAVYARSFLFAPSPSNIIHTEQTGVPGTQDATSGAIEVSFATGQFAVSIDDYLFQASEAFGSTGYGYMRAYDSSFNLLGDVFDYYNGNPANLGVTKTLSFSSAAGNISYLLLGDVQGANIISAFDNLCYSSSASGCTTGGDGSNNGGETVPEPASITLLGLGVVGLIARKIRKS